MAELSFLARLVLTLLLLALSLVAYKWLYAAPSNSSTKAPPKRVKRRSKKKAAKKANPPSPSSQQTPKVPATAPVAAPTPTIPTNDDVSDSDSDDGLSAAQILASRKFQPKSLGGTRLARKIKASLLPAGAPRFQVDQPVLARFEGGDRWFPATVLEQRKGNEYHLKYDDGQLEYRVPAEFIKLRPTKSDEDDSSDDGGDVQVSEVGKTAAVEQVEVQEELSDSDLSESDDDDGWQVVGTSTVAKRHAKRAQAAAPAAEVLVDGLTKCQRENRRKKERQREKKEMLRQHAQEGEFDARNRWRYAPS